jgi:hypothetical protein
MKMKNIYLVLYNGNTKVEYKYIEADDVKKEIEKSKTHSYTIKIIRIDQDNIVYQTHQPSVFNGRILKTRFFTNLG